MPVGTINCLRQASKGKTVFDEILKIASDSRAISKGQIIRTFIPIIYLG